MSAPITQRGAPRVTKNSIEYNFSYNDPTAVIARVEFFCRGPTTSQAHVIPPATSVIFTDLEPNTNYTTTAIPYTAEGIPLEETVFPQVTTTDRPQTPTDVTFRQVSSAQLEVSWTPVASDVKWYVLRTTDNTVGFTIEPWRTTYVSQPLPGGSFKFNLYAVNDAGYSSPVTSQQSYNFI